MTKTSLTPHRMDLTPEHLFNLDVGSLGRDMDSLFGEFFGPMLPTRRFRFPEEWSGAAFAPRCDVEDRENAFVLTAEVPGYTREELTVDLNGETLSLRGEHQEEQHSGDARYLCRESHRGTFERTFHLPAEVDVEQVDAKLRDGVLTLTLPKTQHAQHHRIEVREE